ncbi:putative nudix domain-containing protein [Botrytis cinerea BcDW1]|uniref:Putative nudix domain-containing protein n=1 Tax=Botryotinia fuckeliana (strain BcDW1) TaxID=1290391 RepID=M7U9X0_BOTF1|nr:putative nudix domain-containing protein [Botrytis cinerea BcDW1]
MSTFQIKDSNVEVTLCEGITKDELLSFPAFKVHITAPLFPLLPLRYLLTLSLSQSWHNRLIESLALQGKTSDHPFHSDPYQLRSVKIQSLDRWGKRIGFIKISSKITNEAGESLPGDIFLRGPSVGMMVIVQPEDAEKPDEERWVVMTVQPRPASGSLAFIELPAGMVDDGTFKGAAAKEIEEELGWTIPADQLTNLSELAIGDGANKEGEVLPRAMFPSAGGCDEYIQIFLHEKKISREELKETTGKLTGLRDQGEKITLKLVKLEDLWKEGGRDSKALTAWALYDGLKRTGKL